MSAPEPEPGLPAGPGGRPRAEAGELDPGAAGPDAPDRTVAAADSPLEFAPDAASPRASGSAPKLAPDRAAPEVAAPERAGPDGTAPDGAAPDDWEARRTRAMRAARGALAGALILEAITVLFVPRAIAPVSGPGLTGGRLAVLLTLAALLLVASGLQRRRWGVGFGSVLQLAVIATGVLLPAMYVLGLVFGAVWVYLLKVRRDLVRATAGPTT